jgi:Mg-chelatase subunit ChlD
VTFPTQDMALLPARSVEDVPDALIDDPRRILHDLAAGRLLVRRYIAEETVRAERTVMRGEVRAYVLDGSGSMKGPRAHMRDAILLAELSTLISRYADRERRVEPVLHFRYFDVEPGPVTRVGSPASALAAIESVVSTLHEGGTDIQRALLSTFEDIRAARQSDPSLARAQLVLVTDGEAAVDRNAVLAARSSVGELPIGVSIIALGQENAALRELAAFQRSQGESVFYHFIPDGEIADIVGGKQGTVSIHPPENLTAAELKSELGGIVPPSDHVESLDAARAVLAAAAQVIDLVGSTSLERRIDAIELVERLLFDAGIPEWHYAELLRRYPGAMSKEIERVRSIVKAGAD